MKTIKYRDESGEPAVIVGIEDLPGVVEGFFDLSHHGQKATLEIVELTQEEYDALPDS